MRWVAALCALLVAVPARALDCASLPDPVAGQPLSAEQLECIRIAIVTLRTDLAVCEAKLAQAEARAEACEATAAITCPPPPVPVVPVAIAALSGVVAGVVLAVVGMIVLR